MADDAPNPAKQVAELNIRIDDIQTDLTRLMRRRDAWADVIESQQAIDVLLLKHQTFGVELQTLMATFDQSPSFGENPFLVQARQRAILKVLQSYDITYEQLG